MSKEPRRDFLKQAGLAIPATALVNLNPRAWGANERPALALVGLNNRGRQLAQECAKQKVFLKTICDLDTAVLDRVGPEIEKAQQAKPEAIRDYHQALEDSAIDGVIIATPDHWHAIPTIEACQAGKDVYIEKPLSHTIEEGQKMRDAARKYNRIVQMGTQRRSANHIKNAIEYVLSGALGKICLIKGWECQVRGDLGHPPDGEPPATVDYDRWLGPAPKRAFNPLRFHYNWRFFWDYCNSEQGNQGVHLLDVAMWGIAGMRGLDNALPTKVSGQAGIYWLHDIKEVPDTQVTCYDYGDFMLVWELRSFQDHHPLEGNEGGTAFYGSEATLVVDGDGWKVFAKDGKPGPSEKASGGSHIQTFVDCMKSRQRPLADVEAGRLSTTICHLGNINYHLHRDLVFDPKTETFGDDTEANRYLKKSYREPYVLPKV